MNEISVVVTIYNAAPSIPELTERLITQLSKITPDFEVILVEDRSKDDSWEVLKTFAAKDSRLKCVRLARNFGQHNAITAGINLVNGRYVVLMDGDLQDEPEVIPRLYEAISGGNNNIYYVRRKLRKDGNFKGLTSKGFYYIFSKLSGIQSDPEVGTFRIMTKIVSDSYRKFTEIDKYVGGIFCWMNFDSGYIDAEHQKRKHGESNYNLFKLLSVAMRGLISFTNKPLYMAIYLGFISSAFAFALGVFFIFRKIILHVNPTGFSSLIVSLYFIGGIILVVLGIIGQYIGAIYEQVKKRPEYLIEEKINFID